LRNRLHAAIFPGSGPHPGGRSRDPGPRDHFRNATDREMAMKKFLLVLLILVVAVLGFIATRPNTFHIERSATIAASSDSVFAKIADFHQWASWSPWEKLDPQMTKSYEGAASGVGASYHWTGNDQVGEGRMTITEADPGHRVGIKLEFLKPWQATNNCTFALASEASGTRVTWTMDGNNNFMAKAMSTFMNMDRMVGGDFEKGLANLKTLTEAEAAPGDTASAAAATPAPTTP
jgi:uncharacterized protein YndB with AHSA1/START domain